VVVNFMDAALPVEILYCFAHLAPCQLLDHLF
jgi:hypothetical protein